MKSNKNKTNLQELILRLIKDHHVANTDDIVAELEAMIISTDAKAHARKVKPRYTIRRTIKQLHKNGMVDIYESAYSTFARLTADGRHKLRSIKLSKDTAVVPTTWDGYWRVVILDLPESRKDERDALRYFLKKAHFTMLKNSVWISPYPLEHFLNNIKKDLRLTDELIIMVVDYLDDEIQDRLLDKFGLQ